MKSWQASLLGICLALGTTGNASAQRDSAQARAAADCTTPPAILGCKPAITELGCNPKSLPACRGAVTASDCRGPVAVQCIAGPVTGSGCQKTQVFTYSATGTGGTSSCTETYTWTADTQAPVITLTPALAVEPACNPTEEQVAAAFGTASVSDNCSTNLVAKGTLGAEIAGGGCSRSLTKSWTVTDSCGNKATASQTVRYKRDTAPPAITCPADVVVKGLGKPRATAVLGKATATDSCGTLKIADDAPRNPNGGVAPFGVGTTIVTWTATDGCGNTSTCRQSVTVLGRIKATAYFDANGNGTQDLPVATTGEGGVPNMKLSLSNGVSSADGTGTAVFDVAPGAYTVSEEVPIGWINTTEVSAKVKVDSTACDVTATLGNVFLCDPSNGLTLGFWASASGAKVLADNPGWVALLNGLMCLRNADGTLHTFTTIADLRTWLLGATSTNMAYLLSAHLATNTLNSSYNGLDGRIFVPGGVKTKGNVCLVPFVSVPQPALGTCGSPLLTPATFTTPSKCGCASTDGQVTIGDLQLKAECLLAAYGITLAASTERTYQECVKDILVMIQHNGNPLGARAYPCGGVKVAVPAGACPDPVTPPVKGSGARGG